MVNHLATRIDLVVSYLPHPGMARASHDEALG